MREMYWDSQPRHFTCTRAVLMKGTHTGIGSHKQGTSLVPFSYNTCERDLSSYWYSQPRHFTCTSAALMKETRTGYSKMRHFAVTILIQYSSKKPALIPVLTTKAFHLHKCSTHETDRYWYSQQRHFTCTVLIQ